MEDYKFQGINKKPGQGAMCPAIGGYSSLTLYSK